MPFTTGQMDAIKTTELVTSSFSVLGSFFVIFTYTASSAFHKPINRLVFYASWGNMATNIATLISRSGIEAGVNTPLCQFQAFLIQMFMPADSLWTLAMAFNVYLTFFHRFTANQLRAQEWKYLIICYGIPFIPAIVFAFTQTEARGKIYGGAVLWCWVTVEWNVLRLATFYGPVWVILLITMFIYALVGKVIYDNRRRFHNLSASHPSGLAFEAPGPENSRTTDIQVTTVVAAHDEANAARAFDEPEAEKYPQYAVNIGTAHDPAKPEYNPQTKKTTMSSVDRAAWAYMKCAMLFFFALLITWVPSTINRVYTFVHADAVSFPLNYIEALVLPLQGFWNAVIYVTTSVPACRSLWAGIWGSIWGGAERRSFVPLADLRSRPRELRDEGKSESTTDLAAH